MAMTFASLKRDEMRERDRRIIGLLPIATMLSSRFAWAVRVVGPAYDTEDIYMVAAEALVRAVDTHDPAKSSLRTYAFVQAQFAVLHAIKEWSEQKPGGKSIDIADAVGRFERANDVAWAGEYTRGVGGDEFEEVVERIDLCNAIGRLADTERTIMQGLVYENKNLAMIAKQLGLSRSLVTRMYRRAYFSLVDQLRDDVVETSPGANRAASVQNATPRASVFA